jgi:16S rRNA (cytosine967-C5)-methyltransferase
LRKGTASTKGIVLANPSAVAAPARQTALRVLYAIDVQHAYTDVALRQTLGPSRLERRERAFVTECVYGVVRWQGRIDWLLQHACHRPLEALTPWIRNILRLGAYQCLWMPGTPARAAVYEAVELARRYGHRGTARLVNGVLRTLLREHDTYHPPDAERVPAAHLAVVESHPQWLLERWLERYGWSRTQAICEANNRPAGLTLRAHTLQASRQDLAARLRAEGVTEVDAATLGPQALWVQGTSRLDHLPSYREGLFQVQDSGAMLVAPLCDVRPGQRVLDACAAPGGKTTHLAQLMQDTGRIVALDVQPGRLRLLRQNLQRLQLTCVTPIAADATLPLPLHEWHGRFDRILIDAPCSGLGVLRRHPDIKWRKTEADVHRLQAVQLALLNRLLLNLAPEGLLVYSVCSNEPEETHQVVQHVLHQHPELALHAIEPGYPQPLPVPSATPGTLDLTPEQLGTEGVFVARFRYQAP